MHPRHPGRRDSTWYELGILLYVRNEVAVDFNHPVLEQSEHPGSFHLGIKTGTP